ncbi:MULTISPECIES: amidohydrolase [unclassified Campylobacter]|uniref:amidohydrolase n=1 Tax=unclassified Campylobacter TaxID=2593542 RepID=UPI001D5AF091|nr:amidohydrolase [Campylobacter sp. RM9331]MBZ8005472.1 amidohydrolase [Campylobacter sp. RM9332]
MKELNNLHKEFIELRHSIHANPELGFNEFDTAKLVANKLKEFGYEVYEGIGKTGVVGVLKKGNSTKSIGLRADMDALSIEECTGLDYASKNGCMHACGHDGHTAGLLMAAKYLASANFNGTLNLFFQPAEECCDNEMLSGAMRMIKDGVLERFKVDYIYGIHNMPISQMKGYENKKFFMKKGVMMAGVSAYKVDFIGLGGHASAPHLCKDPISVANNFVNALYTFKSLELKDSVVNVTGFLAGTTKAFNIIPNEASVMINVRGLSNQELEFIDTRIKELATNLANAFNIKAIVKRAENIKATINNDEAHELARLAAIESFGEDECEFEHPHLMGSEDFSAFLDEVKGTYAFINNGDSANLHHPEYNFNDEVLLLASKYFANLVLNYLK